MINPKPSAEYREPEVAVVTASPNEALQAQQDRLGGLAELAPDAAVSKAT